MLGRFNEMIDDGLVAELYFKKVGSVGQLRTRFKAKGATRVCGARGCRSRNVSRTGVRMLRFRGPEKDLTACRRQFRDP